ALWPHHPPVAHAPMRLRIGDTAWTATVSVGSHRPWTMYLLSDVCTDCTFVYDHEAACRIDDANLTAAEIALAKATADAPESNRNHYNFVHAREVEYYLERYPERAESLFAQIRRGTIQLNPFFNMA